jgi:hypothetical protein
MFGIQSGDLPICSHTALRSIRGSHSIGIVLCADKSDTLVEYTLPEDNKQIFAAKYLPYMPTKDELRRELKLEEFEKKD